MNNSTCPKFEKCPIFTGRSFKQLNSSDVYKRLYCNAGEAKYKTCKRFIVSEKTGKPVPDNIMPNSTMEIDKIVELSLAQ
jgi:hypothetical protein